jgi:hypothetical protein
MKILLLGSQPIDSDNLSYNILITLDFEKIVTNLMI